VQTLSVVEFDGVSFDVRREDPTEDGGPHSANKHDGSRHNEDHHYHENDRARHGITLTPQ